LKKNDEKAAVGCDPELKEINRNISQVLTLLANKINTIDGSDGARKHENYNKSPSEGPPAFIAGKHSIKRFYNTSYKQWRSEQKLHHMDDFIWFHKCFPSKNRANIFNILANNKTVEWISV